MSPITLSPDELCLNLHAKQTWGTRMRHMHTINAAAASQQDITHTHIKVSLQACC